MRLARLWIILSLVSFYTTLTKAQFQFRFENTSLLNGSINCIFQNSQGYMWLGTGQGLFRYDGYKFKLFLIDPDNKNSLTINTINCLYEDHLKQIWIGTVDGIYRFDPITEAFQSFADLSELNKIGGVIKSINQDGKNKIWFTTQTYQNRIGGLVCYDQQKATFEKFNFDGLFNFPRTILTDKNGNFWIACDKGVVIFNPDTKAIVKNIDFLFSGLQGNDISSLYQERTGVIWATSYYQGIARINYDSSYNLTIQNFGVIDGLESNNTYSITQDSKGNYWIATQDGVNVFNPIHKTMIHLKPKDNNPFTLKADLASSIFEDPSGNIWIGHPGSGLSRVKYNKGFITLSENSGGVAQLKGNTITSVYADPSDNLWAATWSYGVHKIKFKSDFMVPPEVTFYPITNARVFSIERNNQEDLLLADGGGLCLLNELTGHLKYISVNRSDRVRKLEDGILFSGERKLHKALERNSNYHIQELVPDSSARNQVIRPEYSSITQESKNLYWISTWQGDLYSYNNENNTFILPKRSPYELLRISNIHIDRKKFLWLTAFEGVFQYKIKRTNSEVTLRLENKYTEKDGLIRNDGGSNLFTSSMSEDDHGRIWLAQVGLTVLNPETGKLRTYYEEDGLPSNAMSITKGTKMKNGYLVFGTNRGLFLFHPDSLKDNAHIPPVAITDFTVLNTSRSQPSQQKKLEYFENVLTFEFAALDFTAPQNNQYAYQLVGFDPDWVYSGTRRTATYTNLDPGTYTFRAKGSNNDGVWNEEGASISILILPPPWKTWWAYSAYGIAFLLLLVIARNDVVKRERLKVKSKLKEMEADKYHELDTLKSHFFANISHEFRTPLTLILGPLEKRLAHATEDADKKELSIMHRSASRLLTLVNQLLDLSRLEAGTLTLKGHVQSINEFIPAIASQFSSMADSKTITFQLHTDQPVALFFDPDKLEKIITNLLSNAFKFTPSGGTIMLTLAQHGPTESFKYGYAEIKVDDSGSGIEAEHLGRIFDRFYQADTSTTRRYEGSGIGLALTKELVELHQGSITVASTPGKGSCFTVQLPLGTAHLKASDIEYMETKVQPSVLSNEHIEVVEHERETEESSHPRVLIVEDNADLRFYLHNSLKEFYEVQEGDDGEQGYNVALEIIPDLIISDLMMPRMDGLQLCQKLKSNEKTSHIPIILLTAKADIETKLEGLHIGADDYIAKPFDARELQARIHNLIESRRKLQLKFSQQFNPSASEIKVESLEDRFLKKVKSTIEVHMGDSTFGVESLANEVAMSTIQLYRKLKALTGYTPNELIRNMRMDRAASLLRQHAGNVSEVAYQVGFNSMSYFAKCFKEKFHESPSEFLSSHD